MSEQELEPEVPFEEPETPAEPEPGDEPTEDEEPEDATPSEQPDEPEAPPEPQGMSEKELEKAMKQIEKLREHVANRLGTIMGEDSQLLEACPVCGDSYPGHIFPPDVAPPDDATVAAVRRYIGMPDADQFQQHPDFKTCEECNGLAEVLTGSLRPGYMTQACPGCNGLGYKEATTQRVLAQGNGQSEPAPVMTGPTVAPSAMPTELAHYKEQGWLIVPPTPPVVGVEQG
jgi:hypothetical protein